jgi:hypothetical protein
MTKKLIRVTTVPISLNKLLKGQMKFMSAYYEVLAVSSESDFLRLVGANEGVKVKGVEIFLVKLIRHMKDIPLSYFVLGLANLSYTHLCYLVNFQMILS